MAEEFPCPARCANGYQKIGSKLIPCWRCQGKGVVAKQKPREREDVGRKGLYF